MEVKTRWLRGAHTFGKESAKPKQSGRVQGRAAVLLDKSTKRLISLMEKGSNGDPLSAQYKPIHRKARRNLIEHNEYAVRPDNEKINMLYRKIKKLKAEFENLKFAPQRRRAFMAPLILKQIDEEKVKLSLLLEDIKTERMEVGEIIEIKMGDLSEFQKKKKRKKKNDEIDVSKLTPEQYLKLVEEQNNNV